MKSTHNLPSRLKELRKKNRYSQEYVAEQLNISRQAISLWENGKSYPDIDNLVLLAELYHVSVDELLRDEVKQDEGEQEHEEEKDDHTEPAREKDAALEMIGLAVILILSINFPFCAIPVSTIILFWMIRTERNYKIIYIICIVGIIMGIHEIFSVFVHVNDFYGNPVLVPIN